MSNRCKELHSETRNRINFIDRSAEQQRTEGGVRIFGFADLANASWFVFLVFALKNCGVFFGVFSGLRVFSNLVFGFLFLSTIMAVFQISLSNAFYGFSGFGKQVTPCSRAKTVISRDLLYSLRLPPRPFF